jgi:hypothetical protein
MSRILNILNLKIQKRTPFKSTFVLLTPLVLTLLYGACSKQEFNVSKTIATQKAPGTYTIPPKIDFLLAEDDTGSIFEAYTPIANQLPLFLRDLEKNGWDYHFATTPLTRDRPLNEIIASKFDLNWGSQWLPSLPGMLPEMIPSAFFRKPEQYAGFLTSSDINNGTNGLEPGFETVRRALYNQATGTGFLREDALLVILVVGNGEDTSGVTLCTRVDGFVGPCENMGMPGGTLDSSFTFYRNQFLGLKSAHDSLVRFYSAVSKSAQSNCLGGKSYVGLRYQKMALGLGGAHYDICSQPISTVLSALNSSLQIQRLSFRTRYLFLDREPDPVTIKIEKFLNGDPTQVIELAQSATQGWTYAGYLKNVFAIDSPAPLNLSSGYAIELHGSAKLVGNDTAEITFKPIGARDSSR